MAASRERMIAILNEKFPNLNLKTTEQFDGTKNGIWVSGTEDGITAKDGLRLFNYYAEDNKEVIYQFGVHKEIRNLLEKNGWFAEWYDCGTIMFWIN